MAGTPATLPSPYGLVDWIDFYNNWTAADAEWIQKRSVLRFSNESTRNSALGTEAGVLSYVDTPASGAASGEMQWCGKDGAYRKLLSPQYLALSESASVVGLKLSSNSATVQIKSTSVELGPSQQLIVSTSGLVIKTGDATVTVTTTADALRSDTKISAPSIASDGAITGTSFTGAVAATTVTVGTSLTAGAITLTNASGAIAATTVAATSTVTATTSVTGGTAKLATTSSTAELSSTTGGHGGYVRLTADTEINGTYVKLKGVAQLTGSTTATAVAGVVVASSGAGLTASNYPNGTFWVQT